MSLSFSNAHEYMHLRTNDTHDYIYFNSSVPLSTCIYAQMIIMITCVCVCQWC